MRVRTCTCVCAGVTLLALTVGSRAIDRDASMIDAFALESYSYDLVDVVNLNLTSEIGLATFHKEWAILAGAKIGQTSPDAGTHGDEWGGMLGVKYYLTDLTSFFVAGSYESWDRPADIDVTTGTLGIKYRFLPADEVVSPFATASAAVQGFSEKEDVPDRISLTQGVLTLGLGCDFMMTEDMAIVFQGTVFQSQKISGDGDDTADGWMASAAMTYYWE